MSTRTAEEVRLDYVAAMGSTLGEQFHRIVQECFALRLKWKDYVALFGTDPERIDVLNAAAPTFFGRLEESLWDDVLLHICRLTDQPKTAGKDTLTLRRLPSLVTGACRDEATRLLEACVRSAGFARDWRNRRIGHAELSLALREPAAKPLAPGSRLSVQAALVDIETLVNAVGAHHGCSPVGFEYTQSLGDAESLLRVLRAGLDVRRQQCGEELL